jgi:hypothetical protein
VKALARGVRVDIYEISGDWRRIHSSQQQWVAMRYLRIVDEGLRSAAADARG